MRRLFFFLLRLAVLVALAVWLADRPGTARIVWHGYIVETSAAALGLVALAVGVALYLAFRLWHLMRHGPELWAMGRRIRKLKKGQHDLERGLVAIASGDAAEAGRLAVSARRKLGVTTATQWLQAQAAQMAGDRRAAQDIFQALSEKGESAALGYRGLIMEARRRGDYSEASRLVDQLGAAKPALPWLGLARFETAARQQDWSGAKTALAEASRSGLLAPARRKTLHAALLVASSQEEARSGRRDRALQDAEAAQREAPGWLPAVINLAQRQAEAGHRRAALRTVEKNWARAQHPQLATVAHAQHDRALEAYRQIVSIVGSSGAASPVSRMVLGEAALCASLWGEARRHFMALVGQAQATRETYRLLARLERREHGDEAAALQWLAKAADAMPDAVWICRACGGTHEKWQAVCTHCHNFGGVEWRTPGVSRVKELGAALEEEGVGTLALT
ncbi:MAG: heme biosynthesis HemY N-terminal domain-containing protein [Bdellovibrionales bacterium]